MKYELIEDNVKVVFEYIGEGWNGDYNPDDPEDEPLLRFDVFAHDCLDNPHSECSGKNGFGYMLDSSYCTQMPCDTPKDVINKALRVIMDEVKDPIKGGNSIKRTCERLSWLCPDDFKK